MTTRPALVFAVCGLSILVTCKGDEAKSGATSTEASPAAKSADGGPADAQEGSSAAVADQAPTLASKAGGTPAAATRLVPDAAVFLAHIDVRAISGSAMWGANKAAMEADPEAKKAIEALEKCNLDIDELDSITLAGDDQQQELVVVVGKGIGKAENLECIGRTMTAELGEGAWKLEQQGSERVVSIDGGTRIGHMVDPDTLVVCSKAWDETVQSLIAGEGAGAVDGRLKTAVAHTNADANIWFAARVPEAAAADLRGSPAEGLAYVAGSVDLGEGLGVGIQAGTASPEKAAALQKFLTATYGQYKGMAAMVGIPAEVADKVRFGTDGAATTASLQLTRAEVEQVRANMEKLSGGAPPLPPPPPP